MANQKVAETSRPKISRAQTPPMEASEEAKKKHLDLAKKQGQALERALSEMTGQVAQRGAEKAAGHFLVGYAIEKPEGMYMPHDGELKWHEPEDENLHIEVSVRDAGDGRFVPALDVTATVLDEKGVEVGTHVQHFLWHPWLYHYGRNWQLPGDGKYTFRIKIEMPQFPRHDKKNGRRYTGAVLAEFRDVPVKIYPPNKK